MNCNDDGCEYRIESDDGDVYRINTVKQPKTSRTEVRDILIAVLVLTLAFTILYRSGSVMMFFENRMGDLAYLGLFGTCLGLVILSFLLHEILHKHMAQKAGMWSEFRMYPLGLLLTLVTSFMGFLFAAPGAVCTQGYCDKETEGKISIAGPVINVALAAIGIIGCLQMNGTGWVIFFFMLANLNAFLAVFNLIPLRPMDGSKVLAWNPVVWVVAIAAAVLELVYILFYMPGLYFPMF